MTNLSFFERIKKKITRKLQNSNPTATTSVATDPNTTTVPTTSTDITRTEPTATPDNYEGSFVDEKSPLAVLMESEQNRSLLDSFRNELRDKTVFEAWINEFLLCEYFLKYFLSFISAIGAFFYIFLQFEIIQMPTLAAGIAFLLVSIIAAFQHFILPKAANKLVKGAILGSLVLLAASFALSVVSVQSSTLGNADLVANFYDKYAPKAVKADIKTDSTELANNKRKLIENDSLIMIYMGKANVKKNTDFITAKENENLTIRAENKDLQKRIDKAKFKAENETGENKTVHKADKESVASAVFKISLANEFLILLVFLFLAWYKRSSIKQLAILQANNLTIWQYRTGLKVVPLEVQQTGLRPAAQTQQVGLQTANAQAPNSQQNSFQNRTPAGFKIGQNINNQPDPKKSNLEHNVNSDTVVMNIVNYSYEDLAALIKAAKLKRNSYAWKLKNNKGNPANNEAKITAAAAEILRLESLLKQTAKPSN